MDVWLNGQLITADDATIAVLDAGFKHGVGLFETMAVYNGHVFRPEEHVKRLVESAQQLHLSEKIQVIKILTLKQFLRLLVASQKIV